MHLEHLVPFCENRELAETIRRTSQSLAELAERTGRKKPNLSRTLKTMEQYGLVQISRQRKLVPRVNGGPTFSQRRRKDG